MNGIITKGIGGFYYVKAADDCIYECKARGRFRKERIVPVIGDCVEIEVSGKKGSITEIKKRRNCLIRPSVANIDTLIIVAAAASPSPNTMLMDKLTVMAEVNGIEPLICVNKTDLADGEELRKVYSDAGYRAFCISAENGSGVDALMPLLKDKTTAFAGLSGVGKSTLLNCITDACAETGSVSEKIQRGKHTTRHVELFALDGGGFVLDTPGFSSFELSGVRAENLWEYFPEMREVSGNCRFRGCSHINEPDCEVKRLLDAGIIAKSRYNSYKELYNILKEIKDWNKNDTVTFNFIG